jgi:hypothetical protein
MIIVGLLFLGLAAVWIGGSVALLIIGAKNASNPDYPSLKAKRDAWRRQLMSRNDWQQVVSIFGDLSSEQYQAIYNEHVSFLQPLLDGDFQKYLAG